MIGREFPPLLPVVAGSMRQRSPGTRANAEALDRMGSSHAPIQVWKRTTAGEAACRRSTRIREATREGMVGF